jgi:hypothetical protein
LKGGVIGRVPIARETHHMAMKSLQSEKGCACAIIGIQFVTLKLFSGATTIPFEQMVIGGRSIVVSGLYTDDLRVAFGHPTGTL